MIPWHEFKTNFLIKGESKPRKNINKFPYQKFMGKGNFLDLIGKVEDNQ
jgi:hypothetical protein